MEELSAKDIFEGLVVEGKSCEKMLKELESLREVLTQDLLVKAMVSTDAFPENGIKKLELIDDFTSILEKADP